MESNCPECGSPQYNEQMWTCGTYRHGDKVKISQTCDYLSQLHEAKAENAALTAEVERLRKENAELQARYATLANEASNASLHNAFE